MNKDVLNVFNAYNEAFIKSDFAALFDTMADDITWHQPGNSVLSGVITGKQALGAHLAQFAEKSNGTLQIITNWASSNGDFVAAQVTFVAERQGHEPLNMKGIDLFRIEDGKIKEVWLFSSDPSVEDQFWS